MSRLRTLAAGLGLGLLALLLAPGSFAAAAPSAGVAVPQPRAVPGLAAGTGSVLGYQCGEGICLIDPDAAGAQPTQVVPDGRFAGVTADGRTVAWVQPTGDLVTAPTTGGTLTTVYAGAVGFQPVISPDGASFLWQFPVQIAGYYYTYRLDVATGEAYGIAACSCTVTHGWAGAASIGVFPGDSSGPSQICVLDPEGASSCVAVLASESRGQLAFPDGSADGGTFVASMDPNGSEFGGSQGRIALYSRTTGALVRDLTTNDTDTTATLSTEGDRVAFDRADQIVVLDITTGAERVVGPGVYPSWGGSRAKVSVPAVTAKRLRYRQQRIKVPITCAGPVPCRGRLSITQGKKNVLAVKVYSVKADGSRVVKVKPSARGRRLLRGDGMIKVTVTLKPSKGKVVRTRLRLKY